MALTPQELDVESSVAMDRNVALIDRLVAFLAEGGSPAAVRQTVKLVEPVFVGRIVVPPRLLLVQAPRFSVLDRHQSRRRRFGDISGQRVRPWRKQVGPGHDERGACDLEIDDRPRIGVSEISGDVRAPLTIGRNVTVGHQVMLHGCTIGDGALIGIQAVVLNKSVIGKDCLVGAGAVVTEGKSFPDRSVIFGSPAKVVRELNEENATRLAMSASSYVKRGQNYKANLKRIG